MDGNGDDDDVVVDDANDSGDEEEGTKDSDDEMVIGTECLCLSTTIYKTSRCSRCTEAILNEVLIDLTASGPIA